MEVSVLVECRRKIYCVCLLRLVGIYEEVRGMFILEFCIFLYFGVFENEV